MSSMQCICSVHTISVITQQGIIYPVSHSSLRCSFYKVQNNVKNLSQKTAMQCLDVLECACKHILLEESECMVQNNSFV